MLDINELFNVFKVSPNIKTLIININTLKWNNLICIRIVIITVPNVPLKRDSRSKRLRCV